MTLTLAMISFSLFCNDFLNMTQNAPGIYPKFNQNLEINFHSYVHYSTMYSHQEM